MRTLADLQTHFYARIREVSGTRKYDGRYVDGTPACIVREAEALLPEINAERVLRGLPEVDLARLLREERAATGADYGTKYARYLARVCGGK